VPFENEHACRLRDPGDFQEDSFRRMSRETEGKEYFVIMGKLKGEDNMMEQSFRYPKETWMESEAKEHCSDHDGMMFEPAMEEEDGEKSKMKRKSIPRHSLPKPGEWGFSDAARRAAIYKERARATRCLFQKRPHNLRVVAQAEDDVAEIFIYDVISLFGVDAQAFVKEIDSLTAATIRVRINSPGGDVFDADAIHNAIARHKSKTEAWVDGLAASAAGYVAIAADEVIMAKNSMLMIHDPWSAVVGNAREMRKEANILDKIGKTIAKMYQDKTDMSLDEIQALMAEETWYDAEEAVEAGIADRIFEKEVEEGEEDEEVALNRWNLSLFQNAPEDFKKVKREIIVPDSRDVEAVLCDAGYSRKVARAIVAMGVVEPESVLRDAATDMGLEDEDKRKFTSIIQGIQEIPQMLARAKGKK